MIIQHSHDCWATTVFRKWSPSLVFRAVVWERLLVLSILGWTVSGVNFLTF